MKNHMEWLRHAGWALTAAYTVCTVALVLPAMRCEDWDWSGSACEAALVLAYVLDLPIGTLGASPPGIPMFPIHGVPNGLIVGSLFHIAIRIWNSRSE